MSDDLIDRIAADLAAGRPIDWEAVMASITAEQRRRLEPLRLADQIRRVAAEGTVSTVGGSQTMPATLPATPGGLPAAPRTWGRYVLVEETGSGSFGTVFKAVDPDLRLDVAIKVLHHHVENEVLRQRLIDEGRALARIKHQNVVRVHRVEFNGDRAGLCTEFIEGQTLDAEVREHGTLSQAQAIEIGEAVCQALSAVHRAGFIHRDVKARNVMRERDTGRIVLMDFGAGRELEQELSSPVFGLTGTALYMAPELLEFQHASHASDVYSVGVLLYYVLSGAYPVEGTTFEELTTAHRRGLRSPLADRRPDLPPAFLRVIDRALAPRGSRYATPGALSADLEAVRAERPRWIRRLKVGTTITGVGLAALVVLGAINSVYFNSALGRAGFVSEGPRDWLLWGARGAVAPMVIAAFTALGVTLLIEGVKLLTHVTPRGVEQWRAGLVHRWSLDDVAVLSSISFLASAGILFAAWWYFTPLLSTLSSITLGISTVALEKMELMSPAFTSYHLSYRKAFLGTTLACVMLWYPTLRLAVRTRQRLPRHTIIGGAIVLAFSLLLLDFPYRLLTQDVFFDEASWEGHPCHVLGARDDQRLVFCPSLPVPRNRTVSAESLTPLEIPPVDWNKEGDAKHKRSVFKFLLNRPVPVREGPVP